MTTAQENAMERIEEIMREHFSSGVLVVQGDVLDNDKAEDIRSTWHGGYATSLGLLEMGKLHVWNKSNGGAE